MDRFSFTVIGSGSLTNQLRNQSCLIMNYAHLRKQQSWVFDCGDGSLRQMINLGVKRTKVNNIFITHLHVDHASGLMALLTDIDMAHYPDKQRFAINIFGPYHLSELVLPFITYSKMCENIDIHFYEFLQEGEALEVNASYQKANVTVSAIYPSEDGYWTCFDDELGVMRSGSLDHVVPCWGYCYTTKETVPTKIAVFGDTCDSSHMKDLVKGCDILFHELSYGPCLLDISRDSLNSPEYKDKQLTDELLEIESNVAKWQKIETLAQKWKHSTAEMVGKYATEVEAKRIVLIHIGSRYEVKNRDKAARIEGMLRKRVKEYYNGSIVLAHDGLEVILNEE